jgi:hypothetical protein
MLRPTRWCLLRAFTPTPGGRMTGTVATATPSLTGQLLPAYARAA